MKLNHYKHWMGLPTKGQGHAHLAAGMTQRRHAVLLRFRLLCWDFAINRPDGRLRAARKCPNCPGVEYDVIARRKARSAGQGRQNAEHATHDRHATQNPGTQPHNPPRTARAPEDAIAQVNHATARELARDTHYTRARARDGEDETSSSRLTHSLPAQNSTSLSVMSP